MEEQLDFRSATSLPRGLTDSDGDSVYQIGQASSPQQLSPRAGPAMRDYSRDGLFSPRAVSPESPPPGNGGPVFRTRNVPGRPMSPETDF
ncbi:AGAP010043-PA-like protein [Anopheles sinensis]|uniref:AGAP010043-PA-like protein n=1 Tax=Anopheles sinensis TaxID=74873 RepID=A0A084VAF6_ANOSI|nr:AGAP010043-PA-like protein [Anopheles sinensis]